ncbi:uncharacterized protein LOC124194839 [Daphnia pulex]|uniref:uncharacterized protein LOC124194839 n=1 Tax=Daphnia pulex TaxID=6669 RepID=UPI001EDFA374|nr:uncharacterized protein LOC124194839 [Daphnia pulex]
MALAVIRLPVSAMAKLWVKLLVTYCFYLFCQSNANSTTAMAKWSSELNKKHLVVLVSEYPVSLKIQRNSTGQVIKLSGVSSLILEWLSRRYQFDYTILDVNVTTLEDGGPKLPGIISYATRGECDVIIAVIRQTPQRLRLLELVHPWMYASMAFMIPMPEVSQNNVDAVVKPFQFWVRY